MKKILSLIPLIFLVGCASIFGRESLPPEIESSESQVTNNDSTIADLESQVLNLTESLANLQSDYDELEAASASSESSAGSNICDVDFGSMKYQNTSSAVSILEGWFALQENVQEIQGTYSSVFWPGVESLTHTIRYINADTGASTATSFLLYFQEVDWSDGLLWVTEQCWLDAPHR
jgi:hypothetical protein